MDEEITPAMFEAGNDAQHPDDCTDVRVIYRAMRNAIAAATGTAKTAKQAECEASQSGGDSRIARKLPETPHGIR